MMKEELRNPVITRRELDPREIEEAKALYKELGPGNASLIVREMRARGWRKFILSELSGNWRKGMLGLEKGLGWIEEWSEANARWQEEDSRRTGSDEGFSEVILPAADARAVPGFPEWLEATKPEWKWRWKHQKYMYRKLELITSGKAKRAAFFLPPRHGKSELVTVRYAAWRLAREPKLRIVIGSYNQKLANRFSRQIKAIYRRTAGKGFNGCIDQTRVPNARDEWETSSGGGVKAVGVGAGITGFGADLIIIDDPIKSRAEAESKNNRDRIWEWYTDDLITRLEPNGAVVLIQTRWHPDDLAGRLLRESQGQSGESRKDRWEVVSLPALAE